MDKLFYLSIVIIIIDAYSIEYDFEFIVSNKIILMKSRIVIIIFSVNAD